MATKVKELIGRLQEYDQEAEVIIAESQYDWHSVLVILQEPGTPDSDENVEVAL
jgi:hypothetical protein